MASINNKIFEKMTVKIELPNEFLNDIDNIKKEIATLKLHFQPKQPPTYITRFEVSKMLNVSLVTLNKWNKNGKLKAVGIGGRVLYRQEDINNSIVEL